MDRGNSGEMWTRSVILVIVLCPTVSYFGSAPLLCEVLQREVGRWVLRTSLCYFWGNEKAHRGAVVMEAILRRGTVILVE